MTDPYKSGYAMAEKTATTILLGCDGDVSRFSEDDAGASLPEKLAYLAFSRRHLSTMDKADRHLAAYHAGAALRIVAQALNLLDPSNVRVFADRVLLSRHHYNAMDTLLANVQNADRAPHAAYVSTQILVGLCRAGVPIHPVADDFDPHNNGGCRPVAEYANRVGSRCHAALAQASLRLLQELAVVRG